MKTFTWPHGHGMKRRRRRRKKGSEGVRDKKWVQHLVPLWVLCLLNSARAQRGHRVNISRHAKWSFVVRVKLAANFCPPPRWPPHGVKGMWPGCVRTCVFSFILDITVLRSSPQCWWAAAVIVQPHTHTHTTLTPCVCDSWDTGFNSKPVTPWVTLPMGCGVCLCVCRGLFIVPSWGDTPKLAPGFFSCNSNCQQYEQTL